jgi:hypothetical protein
VTERYYAVSFPDFVEICGVVFLWLVVLLRAIPSVHHREQRTIWAALLLCASAMSLEITPVYELATSLAGRDLLGANRDIVTDIVGLFAAAAIFGFVLKIVGWGDYSRLTYGIALVVTAVLLLIHRFYDARSPSGLSQHSTAGTVYWLTLLGYHFIANLWCACLCWRCIARAGSSPLKTALRLFCAGTAMATLLMVLSLIYWFTQINSVAYLFPLVAGAEAFLYGAVGGLPIAKPVVRALREAVWLSQLYPLWRDITKSIDGITLHKPRSFPLYLLLSRFDRTQGLYRRVIEVQDGMLTLRRYAPLQDRLAATRFVQTAGVDHRDIEPAASACWIAAGLQAKSKSRHTLAQDEESAQQETNLFVEAAHLGRIAFFYRSPLPDRFVASLHQSPGAAERQTPVPGHARVKSSKSKPGETTQLTRTS